MHPGDHIGEMSLIDNEPHSATVRAEVQTDVLVLGRAEFARCLPENNSSMAYAVMRGLVQRLRQADRKIESLALMDVYGRVAPAGIRRAPRRHLLIRDGFAPGTTSPRWSAPRARWSGARDDEGLESAFIQTRPTDGRCGQGAASDQTRTDPARLGARHRVPALCSGLPFLKYARAGGQPAALPASAAVAQEVFLVVLVCSSAAGAGQLFAAGWRMVHHGHGAAYCAAQTGAGKLGGLADLAYLLRLLGLVALP